MKTKSAKAKGRRLQNHVRDSILSAYPLHPSDVTSAVMGERGEDIKLSQRARAVFPFAVECKNLSSIAAVRFYEQAEAHAKRTGGFPLVVLKEDHGRPLALIDFNTFLGLTAGFSGSYHQLGSVRYDKPKEQSQSLLANSESTDSTS